MLNNKQKIALKYNRANAAQKAVLDKIAYFNGNYADGYDTKYNDGFFSVSCNSLLVDYDCSNLQSKNGYTIIVPLRIGRQIIFGEVLGILETTVAVEQATLMYCSLNVDQLVYRHRYRDTGDVWRENATVTGATPNQFDCLILSVNKTNCSYKCWNFSNQSVTDVSAPANFKDFGVNGFSNKQFSIFGLNNASIYRYFSGQTFSFILIEEQLTNQEIIDIRNHLYEIYKPLPSYTYLKENNVENCEFEFLPHFSQTFTNLSSLTNSLYSNLDFNYSTLHKLTSTSGKYPYFCQNSWGDFYEAYIPDFDQEEVGVNAAYAAYKPGTLSKVAGSPGGSGLQVLRYVASTNTTYGGITINVPPYNGAYQASFGNLTAPQACRIQGWVRGKAASNTEITIQTTLEPSVTFTVPGDENWYYFDRIIDHSTSQFLCVFRGNSAIGDYIELDNLKLTLFHGDQNSLVFQGAWSQNNSTLSSTYSMKQIVDNATEYTFAYAIDTSTTDYLTANLKLFSDYNNIAYPDNASVAILETNGTQDSLNFSTFPYQGYSQTPTAISVPSGKHTFIIQRNGGNMSFYVDGVLKVEKTDLNPSSTNIIAASAIGSNSTGSDNYCKFLLGGFWGWKSGSVSVQSIHDYITKIFPLE